MESATLASSVMSVCVVLGNVLDPFWLQSGLDEMDGNGPRHRLARVGSHGAL